MRQQPDGRVVRTGSWFTFTSNEGVVNLINLGRAMWPIALLIIACVAFVILLVWVSSRRPLTPLESILLQVVILGTGLSASYLFNQRSSRKAAEQLVKPHARSAFRRVKSMYSGLFYLKRLIDRQKGPNSEAASQVVEVIEAVVDQQVTTVADAMEDWRDIVPEEVANLERQLGKQEGVELEDLRR